MKKVLVPIANGIEELEAVTVIDVLRRAGAEVTVAAVDNLQVVASRGTKLVADVPIGACEMLTFDLIALPGGMPGAEHLRDCAPLVRLLKEQASSGRLYAAICAAPVVVLQHHGLLTGRRATAHPSFAPRLTNQEAVEERVVVDGNCVTSRGPGTALEFALSLVELLYGKERAEQVAAPMLALWPARTAEHA
ncbi:MAG: DJ-1/PfpI family protein [bacterium]|nr:DJ-1/PfpI family protein [candidate division KSB1 bacterium]MDH7561589.1 DJ-1/PfpI family protein [bacterium]